MKMNNKENNEEQQFKKMIRDYLLEKIEELKYEVQGKDNSFVFLENRTLLTVITYILMQLDSRQEGGNKVADESFNIDELITNLDSMMADNKKEFEEIIHILRGKN
jgi:hypothetical protein